MWIAYSALNIVWKKHTFTGPQRTIFNNNSVKIPMFSFMSMHLYYGNWSQNVVICASEGLVLIRCCCSRGVFRGTSCRVCSRIFMSNFTMIDTSQTSLTTVYRNICPIKQRYINSVWPTNCLLHSPAGKRLSHYQITVRCQVSAML